MIILPDVLSEGRNHVICLFFAYCDDINTNEISLVPTKISLIEDGVSFGLHVETTKLLDMSNRTVNMHPKADNT